MTHIARELEALKKFFNKKPSLMPTDNRKQIATAICQTGTEADVRALARHMSHSLAVHTSVYQQKGRIESAVER